MKSRAEIAREFDGIAQALERASHSRLSRDERALLRYLPAHARTALDIGCGDGRLSRALAARGLRVRGIDLSPGMIALARASTPPASSIEYAVADFMRDDALPETARRYDVVTCVNVLHHVELDAGISRLTTFVAPGGALLIQDVVRRPGLRHLVRNVAGALLIACDRARELATRASSAHRLVREAYAAHGASERYLTPDEAARAFARHLPGAQVEHALSWRYSAIWIRPRDA